jgi:hypothetical protein
VLTRSSRCALVEPWAGARCGCCVTVLLSRAQVRVTLLEIYNEAIQDLLRPAGTAAEKLSVKENKDGSMYVPGITEKIVNSRDEVRLSSHHTHRLPPLASPRLLCRRTLTYSRHALRRR